MIGTPPAALSRLNSFRADGGRRHNAELGRNCATQEHEIDEMITYRHGEERGGNMLSVR